MQITDYRFGIRGHDISDGFASMCSCAVQNNIKNIQFAMAKTVKEVDFDVLGYDETFAGEINRSLRESNLSIPVLGCYINPVHEDEEKRKTQLRRFEAFIRYAEVFHAGVVGTETGRAISPEYTRSKENYSVFIHNLAALIQLAEEYRVNIGIEPVWRETIYSPRVMAQVINDIQSDNLKVIFDLSNLLNEETIPLQRDVMDEAFQLLGDKITTVHLKDFTVKEGKKQFALPCEGMMDVPNLFEQMSYLKNKPNIILDGTPVSQYHRAIERLELL